MSKKNFQAASTAIIKELGDFHSGYFDHAHIVGAETKIFVKNFDSKVSDPAFKPIKEACQRTSNTVIALDALLGSVNSLNQAANILADLSAKTKKASSAEPTHIATRLTTRENREPFQEKEMTAFSAIQLEERAKIDEEFERKVEELKQLYAV